MTEKQNAKPSEARPLGRHERKTTPAVPVRRPARPAQHKAPAQRLHTDSRALYQHFVPYIENAHNRNVRSLKAGVWLLFLLPVILVIIQELTDASRIAFLIIWIVGMFGIATALIFTAYSDHDLKKTLGELKEIIPPEEDYEIGNLLPVDAEGEGWLIDPEDLPIPLDRLPKMGEELKERISAHDANGGKKTRKRAAGQPVPEKTAKTPSKQVEKSRKSEPSAKKRKKADDVAADRQTAYSGKHLK